MNCKQCGESITQPEGRRTKEFCNNTCRSNYWYAKNKKGVAPKKIKTKSVPKKEKPPVIVRDKPKKIEQAGSSVTRTPFMSDAIKKKLGIK